MEGLIGFLIELIGGIVMQFLAENLIYPMLRFIGFVIRLLFNFKGEKRIVLRHHHNNGTLGFVTVFFFLIILIPVLISRFGK